MNAAFSSTKIIKLDGEREREYCLSKKISFTVDDHLHKTGKEILFNKFLNNSLTFSR
jgi:hypothetical protein